MICNYFIFVSININDPIFFSLFAGMTILCNFILMLTWTPACLVIYHQYCRRFSLAPLSTYSWVESSPKLFQFAQKIEGLKSKWDQIWRKFFKTLFPRFILKARYIFKDDTLLLTLMWTLLLFFRGLPLACRHMPMSARGSRTDRPGDDR